MNYHQISSNTHLISSADLTLVIGPCGHFVLLLNTDCNGRHEAWSLGMSQNYVKFKTPDVNAAYFKVKVSAPKGVQEKKFYRECEVQIDKYVRQVTV